MARQARIDYPGAFQHVIVRGIEKREIFIEEKDKYELINRLTNIITDSSVNCYAWSLMDNHFHLLLQTGETPLSKVMRRLLTGYAIYFNKRYGRKGYLFQNRYKSIVCDKDSYLLTLIRYIHLNPVKANIIEYKKLSKYRWTGHKEILEGKSDLIKTNEILSYFDKREKVARKQYLEYILDGLNLKENYEGDGLIRSAGGLKEVIKRKKEDREIYDDRILGDGCFVEKVLKDMNEKERKYGNIKNIEDLIEKVSKIYKIDKNEILETRKHRVRDARAVIVFIGNEELKKTLTEIGKILNISHVAAGKLKAKGKNILLGKKIDFL